MTANEMKFSFALKFDSLFEDTAPAYDDRQIREFLTDGQFNIFLDTYDPFSNKTQRGFENGEKRRRDLEQFIKSASISDGSVVLSASQVGVHGVNDAAIQGYFYDLPENFLYAIEENAITTAIAGVEVPVKPIAHDRYNSNRRNPYTQPWENLVWRMDYSRADHGEDGGDDFTDRTAKRTELIVGKNSKYHSSPGTMSTITDYRVRYLQSPPSIVCDEIIAANQRHCILDETLHRSIVNEAVKAATAAVNPNEYPIKQQEKIDSEN